MLPPYFTPSFPRYLAAKKTVDDRALNAHVWKTLQAQVAGLQASRPLRVLEVGAGIGTMLERTVDWGLLQRAHYTALDALPENIASARNRLAAWTERNTINSSETPHGELYFSAAQLDLRVNLVAIDLFDFIAQLHDGQKWDLIIAHAFLDLMDIPATLPQLFELLRPGGYFYFTINFDGATLFEPAIDPYLDRQIEARYHQTMDERMINGKRSGDSCAGRHLFQHLPTAGAVILAAGASDWVVYPGVTGYPDDEAYFLHFIIHTLDEALRGDPGLDMQRFAGWVAARHAQIEQHQLVYIAHQLDFAGYYPGGLKP